MTIDLISSLFLNILKNYAIKSDVVNCITKIAAKDTIKSEVINCITKYFYVNLSIIRRLYN